MLSKRILVVLALGLVLIYTGCAKQAVSEPEPAEPEAKVEQPATEAPVVKAEETPAPAVVPEPVVEPAELETVYFEYDSHQLTALGRRALVANAELLRVDRQKRIVIEGHCDERGSDEYNLALGEQRAKAAKDYLAELGITPARIDIISYGEEKPVRTGHNEEDWQMNRRVEFKAML